MATPEGEFARSVELEIDDGSETLGTADPKTITDTERRALLQQARHWRVAADVFTLAHGTLENGRPASLVGLRINFSYRPQTANRLVSAEVSVSFQPNDDDGGSGAEFPTVVKFAPRKIRAEATEGSVSREDRVGAKASLDGAGAGVPLGVGVSAERSSQITYTRTYGCDVVGEPWTSDEAFDEGCDADTAVTWHLNEHKLYHEGIPRELRTVVLVSHSQPSIRARIKAKVKTNWGLSLFGPLWPPAAPLVLRDSVAFGEALAFDFKSFSEGQFDAFVGLDRPFEA